MIADGILVRTAAGLKEHNNNFTEKKTNKRPFDEKKEKDKDVRIF